MNYDTIGDAVTMQGGGRGASTLGHIDQYELLRELGGGGFGTVYLARDTVSGIDVAVKGLPPFVKNNREEMENIKSNFALVSRLHHPNIAAALVLHPAKETIYSSEDVRQKLRVLSGDTLMVMEYAPGVTLSQWRKQFQDKKVPVEKALEITRQIAAALDYAHERKIVHRDVKPANVMVETADDGLVTARVLDFGLAAEIRSSMGRVSREIHDTSGTRPYMAPEQWLGGRQGPATDQYALAVLFCELVTGELPFAAVFDTGDPVVMMNVVGREQFTPPPELPKPIRLALSKALAKKPEERFASCGDFVAALEGRKVVGRNSHSKIEGVPVGRGSMMGKIAAGVVIVVALAGGGYFGWMKYDAAVKAREAEQARIAAEKAAERSRIKQEVYELKGKASQAREKNEKEEWHSWPHFGEKAKELEGAFRAGEAAFAKDDYEVARVMFLKVRDNWQWLSSNKVEQVAVNDARNRAEASRRDAVSEKVEEYCPETFAAATNVFEVAVIKFDEGDLHGAKSAFVAAESGFSAACKSAREMKDAVARRREEERRRKLLELDGEIDKAFEVSGQTSKVRSEICRELRKMKANMMPIAIEKVVDLKSSKYKFVFGLAGLACTNCISFLLDERIVGVNDVEDGGFLHVAAICGQLDVIDFLISRGADINMPDKDLQTPISFALRGDDPVAVIRHLVVRGASISNVHGGISLLQEAAFNGKQDVVKYIIEDLRYSPDDAEASILLSARPVAAHIKDYLRNHGIRDKEKERLISELRKQSLAIPFKPQEYLVVLKECVKKYPDDGYVLYEQGNAKLIALEDMPDIKGALECYKQSERAGFPFAAVTLGAIYCDGSIVPKDLDKARDLISKVAPQVEKLANNGDTLARITMAELFTLGIDRETNKAKSFQLNKELMNEGVNTVASVARCYWDGSGCEENKAKAITMMEACAHEGVYLRQVELAVFYYLEGRKSEARKWMDLAREKLVSAANQGDRNLQNILCLWCGKGELGFSWSTPGAIGWLESCATVSSYDAYKLGELYDEGKYVKKDEWEATRWYLKAAEGGYALAQAEVGERYEKGKGCSKDASKAFSWNLKAANQDISYAQYRMANYLVNGIGCDKDVYEGVRWLKKAADADFLPAVADYGQACAMGNGVRKDNDEALKWLTKAAERDHLGATCALANAYASGSEFVSRDMNKALYWLKKAARLGDEGAQEVLRRKNMSW